MKIANWVNQKVKDANFKATLNSKFNSSNGKAVFIKDLLSDIDKQGLNYETKKAFEAFEDIEGKNWYPTIQVIKNVSSDNNINQIENESETIFVFEDQEIENQLDCVAYFENEAIELEQLEERINETNSIGRTIYIIGIDDPILQDGLPINGNNSGIGNTGGSGNIGGSANTNISLILNKLAIRNHKEAWFMGGSEVHCVGFTTNGYPSISGYCGDGSITIANTNCNNADGKYFDYIARRWINNHHTYNQILQLNPTGQDIMNLVFFERDAWPAPKREHTFYFPNGSFRKIKYNSWESPFSTVQLTMNPNLPFPFARGFVEFNSDILYNIL